MMFSSPLLLISLDCNPISTRMLLNLGAMFAVTAVCKHSDLKNSRAPRQLLQIAELGLWRVLLGPLCGGRVHLGM